MITQTINLNLIPGAVPPRVNVTQYDEGSRTIVANLYNGTSSFTPSAGTTAKIKGTKPDKHGFEYDATISGSTVEIDLTQQMSAVAGDVPCEVELTLGDEVLGTGTFVLRVKASALADDTDISETVLPDIIDAAQSSAASAAASAEAAQEAANSVSVEYTASGNPITLSAFPTEATTSMTIAPTQSLHGYDKPWAGGAGKNKCPYIPSKSDLGITVTTADDGTAIVDGTASGYFYTETTTVLRAGSYIASKGASGDFPYLQVRNKSTDALIASTGAGGTEAAFTLAEDTEVKCRLMVSSGTTLDNVKVYPMIRLSTETSGYEPYSNICPITGISTATVQTTDGEDTNTASMALGETVYGGSVNFNAGTGSKTMVSIDLGTLTWRLTSGDRFCADNQLTGAEIDTNFNTPRNALCSQYIWRDGNALYNQSDSGFGYYIENDVSKLFVKDTQYTTVEAFTAAMSGVQLVYELATPTTLTLTPSPLTMLDGAQTVSGNGETVTISYDGDVKQYIDTKVPDAPTTDGTYTLTCVVSGGVPTYSWT